MRRRSTTRSISRWSATARSITTAGLPPRRRPQPPWMLGPRCLPLGDYKWELYNVAKDYSENNDLAAQQPDKLKEMQALFLTEAGKYQVFPLDNSGFARVVAPRPSAIAGKTEFTYTGVNAGIPFGNAPEHLGQGLYHHRRDHRSQRRRGGNDRDVGRALRRLRPLTCSKASRSSPTTCLIWSDSAGRAAWEVE